MEAEAEAEAGAAAAAAVAMVARARDGISDLGGGEMGKRVGVSWCLVAGWLLVALLAS